MAGHFSSLWLLAHILSTLRHLFTDIAKQSAGDDDALNLVCALENLRYFHVAHVAFDGVVAHVARAAQHLHGVGGHFHRHIGGEALGHGGVHGGILPGIQLIGGFVDQQARSLDLHRHVGEHELYALEGSDGLAELLARASIAAGDFKGRLGHTYGDSADIDAPAIQRRKRDFEALSLFANAVGDGQSAILEEQFACRRGVQAHFALRLAE